MLSGTKRETMRSLLLSASPDIYLNLLANYLGVNMTISTQLEWKNGLLTGRLQGENCRGQQKLLRLLAVYDEHLTAWDQSYAYGDSLSDIPILGLVGNPVVINPNFRLRQIARQKGWKIEQWT